jgi:hypothetical protein
MLRIQLIKDYGVAKKGPILTVTAKFGSKLIREGYAREL